MASPRFDQDVTLAFIAEIKELESRFVELAQEMSWVREDLVTASSSSKKVLASEKPKLKTHLSRLQTAKDEAWGAMESLRTFANLSWDQIL